MVGHQRANSEFLRKSSPISAARLVVGVAASVPCAGSPRLARHGLLVGADLAGEGSRNAQRAWLRSLSGRASKVGQERAAKRSVAVTAWGPELAQFRLDRHPTSMAPPAPLAGWVGAS
jgi:hypothetical protein